MQKVSIAIVLSFAAVAGAATLVLSNSDPVASESAANGVVSHFDDSAATEQRILALEAAVSEERRARQLLEDELLILFAEIDQLAADREDRRGAEAQDREASANIDSNPLLAGSSFAKNDKRPGASMQ